ncbi:hypothetical protein G7Z17_g646 [Cylindrodendrum hubeiense]|uniref:Secreted protein n=1 Tax=Cylindrodendrum hubeiense TaxID=595255 RepID=A0A9P5HG89_9HYPO|nr:hypothetical protein G7Z17_g646 [Cylindrodendrum hubeiense]
MKSIGNFVCSALVLGAQTALANNPIQGSAFTNNNGLGAAEAGAPMWYLPSGTCMPSAAEDGRGHQTNGNDPDNCNIRKLSNNCPPQPQFQGTNTFYGNVAGEPFGTIPTYWSVKRCGNNWKIIYYVYFKKDTGHKSDWEGIVVSFKNNGGDSWVRDTVRMEQDGKHKQINWGDINDTFDGLDDWKNFQQKNRDHGKFYFGKFHHSVHQDWHTTSYKDTCGPNADYDFRNGDYQFWAKNHLRHVSALNPNWSWGKATSPANIDICTF